MKYTIKQAKCLKLDLERVGRKEVTSKDRQGSDCKIGYRNHVSFHDRLGRRLMFGDSFDGGSRQIGRQE